MSSSSGNFQRGEIYWVDWSPGRGSEQTGTRPGLIVQRDTANRNANYSNVIVVAVSRSGRNVPFHVEVQPTPDNGLSSVSFIKCEQLQTAAKARLNRFVGRLSDEDMMAVDEALKIVLQLESG
jgi:mRNA interferase MazF